MALLFTFICIFSNKNVFKNEMPPDEKTTLIREYISEMSESHDNPACPRDAQYYYYYYFYCSEEQPPSSET